ncbi:signal peptidase I [Romboutsia sp.]|uniref:signal peptidase I n=1 Tax=Romboutsia sp. TaxID=1965302 RepID=UPI003F40814D
MKNKKTIISKTINCLFVLVCVLLILNFISSKSNTAFNIMGFRTYTVLSGSMEPKFDPGDVIIILNKNRTNIDKGDIVTFYNTVENQIITHRIVEKNSTGYLTKGDNNDVIDDNVLKEENIIGKVLFHIPKVGYIIKFLSNPKVIAIEMFILAGLVIYYAKDEN